MYQARHNRIVILIHRNLPRRDSSRVLKDSIISPQLFQSANSFTSTATRPDLTVINEEERKVFLVEIAVPFDAHIDTCYEKKIEKYIQLCHDITALGYRCWVISIVIGSLGTVHRRVVSGLQLLGCPRYSSKWLARYLSISAALGSFQVWQRRCGDLRTQTAHVPNSRTELMDI